MSEGRPADCNSVLVDTAWPDRGHYRRHVPLRRRRGSSFSAGDGEAFLLALVLAQMLARLEFRLINRPPLSRNLLKRLATPAGLEPATSRLEGECSIQLSYGVVSCAGRGHPRRLIAPASRRGNCFGRLGGPAAWPSGAHAVVAEIIGVAFHFRGALMRLDDRVLHSVLVGEGDRLLDRLEPQLHLV